jgi:spermidine synthase
LIAWETLGRARAPDGGELVLYRRGGEHVIRVDGLELMSSRAHGSEEEMARLACADLGAAARVGVPVSVRVLIGGLGMGYTVRATLAVLDEHEACGADAEVVVAELVPAVVEWNRGPLAHLAGRPLDDPRVRVHEGDVGQAMRAGGRFDAILLDVDNGPVALTRKANHALYGLTGIATAKSALRRGGVLAVWSAHRDDRFVARLRRAGFGRVDAVDVPARGVAGGPLHTIFVARV